MNVQSIAIERIQVDGDTQVRAVIDQEAVAAYAERMLAGDEFPPVTVFWNGQLFVLSDGFHRVFSAKRLNWTEIAADVRTGTVMDARWHAVAANRANGMRLTNADKARAIKRALAIHPEMSDRQLAEHTGTSAPTVGKYRAELNPTVKLLQSDKRVGRDGRKRPATQPPREPPPKTPEPPPPPVVTDGLPPVVSAPEPPPPMPTDKLGTPLTTPELVEAFSQGRAELNAFCTKMSDLKIATLERINAGNPLYADITASQFEADCNNLYRWYEHAKPHAVCPYCGGDGCKACRARGWVNKITFEHAPPETRP